MIFTSFSKDSPIFTVRKYKPKDTGEKKQKDGQDAVKAKEVKVKLDEFADSEIDNIIEGERKGVPVLYEDEKVIAFTEKKPVAKKHCGVAA